MKYIFSHIYFKFIKCSEACPGFILRGQKKIRVAKKKLGWGQNHVRRMRNFFLLHLKIYAPGAEQKRGRGEGRKIIENRGRAPN